MYLSGYSCKDIAEQLNSEGYVTKAGNRFAYCSIYEIIKNEKYTGVYIFNRAESKGYDHKRNSHRSKPPKEIIRIEGGKLKKSKPMYLLSSKIFCRECGCKLYGSIRYRSSANPFHVYVCNTPKKDCLNPKEIDKISLERYVVRTCSH